MCIHRIVFALFLAIFASVVTAQQADLGVQKSGPDSAPAGSDVSYVVTIFNAGPDPATAAVLSDPVPAGMSFVSATQNDGPAFSCDTAVTCTIASFPASASATFTFVFHIDSGTEFLNAATASSSTFDPNEENDTGIAFTAVAVPSADLGLAKSATSPTAAPDSDVTFLITLMNNGPDAATNVVLTDNLPAPLTFVSFIQTSGPAMSCGTSTCTAASFPAFATATFELTGHVPAGTPGSTEITNVATLKSDNDPFEENDVASTTIAVSTADVRVAKSGPANAVAGTTITYDVTVTNDGPDVALNVIVDDPQLCDVTNCNLGTLSPGQSVVVTGDVAIPPDATSWSNTAVVLTDSTDPNLANNSATVPTAITQSADVHVEKTGAATIDAGSQLTYTITVTNDGPSTASNVVLDDTLPAGTTLVSSSCGANPCAIGTLAPNAPVVLTLTVAVPPNASGTLDNTATASSDTPDPDPTDDSATATTTVTQSADVHVEKTAPATTDGGSQLTYTITVTNDGPSSASNVVLDDTIPASTTFVSSSCGANPCAIGSLAPNAPVVLTLTVAVPSNASGTLVNTATATSTTPDPDPTDDSATATTTITQSADLRVEKTGPATAAVSSDITYTITVTNDGPSDASDVVLTDTLPAGMTFVSSSCGANPCAIGTLAANASFVVTLVANIDVNATGTLVDTATVTSSTPDPDPTDDSATASTTVTQSADLRVEKTGPATAAATTDVTYTITVTNDGPSDASDVVLTDTLPAGTTFVSSSCGANPCAIGTLAANASFVVTLVANVDLNATGPLVDTATVTSSTPDPAAANNTATFETAVGPAPADLSIAKSADYENAVVGTNVTYTIVVTNNGPGAATDVVVTDDLPAGTTLFSTSAGCTGTTTVTCTVGTLAAGSSATIELVVTLSATPGTVTNTASVSASSDDPGDDNDAASAAIAAHLPSESVPTLSPLALALLAIAIASTVLVVLRRVS